MIDQLNERSQISNQMLVENLTTAIFIYVSLFVTPT